MILLLFGYDSDDVNAGFYGELDQIAAALNESGTSITVAGHTDDQGSDSYNEDLSQRRSEAVKAYLVGRGVDPVKIRAVGYGESQPVADNSSKEGQAQNRRVRCVFRCYANPKNHTPHLPHKYLSHVPIPKNHPHSQGWQNRRSHCLQLARRSHFHQVNIVI